MTHDERKKKILGALGESELSKTQVADEMGITRQTLSYKIKGCSPWDIEELERLAKIFKKENSYFF